MKLWIAHGILLSLFLFIVYSAHRLFKREKPEGFKSAWIMTGRKPFSALNLAIPILAFGIVRLDFPLLWPTLPETWTVVLLKYLFAYLTMNFVPIWLGYRVYRFNA